MILKKLYLNLAVLLLYLINDVGLLSFESHRQPKHDH